MYEWLIRYEGEAALDEIKKIGLVEYEPETEPMNIIIMKSYLSKDTILKINGVAECTTAPANMLGKEYVKIQFPLGCTVEKAVNILLAHKKAGTIAWGTFNGVTLYSDTVTMDAAYQQITGKTKEEFDAHIN